MQEIWERVKANANPILATLAGILSVVAIIIAAGAMAGANDPAGITRAEAQEMIDDAVLRVTDPPAYAQAFVARAISRYEAEGRDATVAYYNTRESVDGPWYVIVYDEDTETIAHATRKDFIGQSVRERSDITGKPYGLEIGAADEDGRWVDYVFVNPATGEPQRKHTWVIKHDGLLFAAGWYEPISREDDPATFTQAFVARALSRYDAEGLDATVAHYNSSEGMEGPWYVFFFDEDDRLLTHPDPSLRGQDLKGPLGTDITGRVYGAEMLEADENGRWVDYVFVNPETGQQGVKHSWVVRHDGLLIGSGWYEE